MGKNLTGVMSFSDAHANLDGIRFYRDFFEGNDPIIGVGKQSGKFVKLRNARLCDYVTNLWDETSTRAGVVYTESTSTKIKEVIKLRLLNPNPSGLSRDEVLARPGLPYRSEFKDYLSDSYIRTSFALIGSCAGTVNRIVAPP